MRIDQALKLKLDEHLEKLHSDDPEVVKEAQKSTLNIFDFFRYLKNLNKEEKEQKEEENK